jgi:hypothetical protein
MAEPLTAAQKALADKQFEEARRQLKLADAMADKSPYERYVIGRMQIVASAGLRDAPAMIKAVEDTLATGQGEPALRLGLMNEAANAAYGLKDYPATVRWSREYLDAGGQDLNARLRLAQAQYLLGRHAEAATLLDDLLQRQRKAGQQPGESQLRLQASNCLKSGDEAGYARVLEQLIASYPKPEYWTDRIGRVARQPGFDERLRIDVLRLGAARQAWPDGAFYVELAERAMAAGFAAEAERALQAAQAAGLLAGGAAAGEHEALMQRARKQAQQDRRDLGASTAASLAGKSGQAIFNAGYNEFTLGRTTEGLAMMEQGLDKGVARDADDAQLRLGAAYAMTGDAAKARHWLAPLAAAGRGDGLSDLARLWLLGAGGS